ncbi:FxsA family protein [Hamadaea sp. NPDC050747]|uniref:FxsA family protein n=1 Tax=Hamadaea sp. NPDC050747 TaxID=3155789 RepID=UPI0033D76D76
MRSRWRFVPLAVLILAIVEIAVFVGVAQLIGFGWALFAVLLLSAAGMFALAREGKRGWRRVRDAARSNSPVGPQAADGIAGAVGALLLFVPGFFTGLIGALLLIPPIRKFAARRAQGMTEKRVPSNVAGDLFGPRQVRVQRTPKAAQPTETDEVIEGEIVD